MIGNDIILTVVDFDRDRKQIRLGFEAPESVIILREEIVGIPYPKYLTEEDLKCLHRHNTK
jgi:carbon storage regulator CsrA